MTRLRWRRAGLALAVLWAVATTVGPFSDTTVNDLYVYRTYADLLRGRATCRTSTSASSTRRWRRCRSGCAGLPGRDEATYAVSFARAHGACALVGQQLAARLAGGPGRAARRCRRGCWR